MVKIKLEFVNEKGNLKKVEFYLDKLTYEVYLKLPHETMLKYLVDEYHEFCREKHYERKFVSFIEKSENESLNLSVLDEIIFKELLFKIYLVLDEEEKKLITDSFYNGKTKTEIAKENGVSEGAIRKRLKRIFSKMRKQISDQEKKEILRILFLQ